LKKSTPGKSAIKHAVPPICYNFRTMSEFIDHVVRVRYAETDKMSIVYYANYFIYFEIGRVEYMRQRGLDYRRMEQEDDSFTVVAEAKCRYRRPARYDDPLRIRTRVTSVKSRVITFGYEILHDETNELLVTGETIHVVCNSKGRPKPLPDKYRQYFDWDKLSAKASDS